MLSTEWTSFVFYVDEIISYADRRMAHELQAMPDGVYRAKSWIDSDGIDELNIPIEVAVTIDEGRGAGRLHGSGPQAKGGVNGSLATSMATAAIPFLYYVAPDIPQNQAASSTSRSSPQKGRYAMRVYPASTSCATAIPSDCMHDAINMAMAQAIPDRVPAGGTETVERGAVLRTGIDRPRLWMGSDAL